MSTFQWVELDGSMVLVLTLVFTLKTSQIVWIALTIISFGGDDRGNFRTSAAPNAAIGCQEDSTKNQANALKVEKLY